MTSRYKAVLFDMDGTLVDSMYAWRGVFREFICKHSMETPEKLIGIPECPIGRAAELLKEQFPDRTVENIISEMLDMIDRHYATDARAKTDAPELVRRLKGKGFVLAIATATQLKYANTVISRLGYDKAFDLIVSNQEVGASKDQPEFFIRVAETLGFRPEECVVFEDALYAMKSAKAAGLKVCAIEDYYAWRHKEEIQKTADLYLACYRDLLDEMDS